MVQTTSEGRRADARILIVDDQEANVRLLQDVLVRAGYQEIEGLTDPRRVPDVLDSFQPDLILLDLLMPYIDGLAVLDLLPSIVAPGSFLPVLVLTADASADAKLQALAAGASDFLTKPFDVAEVTLRVGNLLHTRFLHLQLQDHNRTLEERVSERTQELKESYHQTLERLALAAEYRDDDTGEHIRRVGRTAALVARELGLSPDQVELIGQAAALHDVGKIGVPDAVLLKPASLTPEEFEIVKTHTEVGARILAGSRSPLLQLAERIARAHHERWDGTGYTGVPGDAIPLEARITAVADAFDAMTNDRPYRRARPLEEALIEVARQRGRQFDPEVADAFLRVHEEISPSARRTGHSRTALAG
jgi:putative two-component system response regulator